VVIANSTFNGRGNSIVSNGGIGLDINNLSHGTLFDSFVSDNGGPGVAARSIFSILVLGSEVNTFENNTPDVLCEDSSALVSATAQLPGSGPGTTDIASCSKVFAPDGVF